MEEFIAAEEDQGLRLDRWLGSMTDETVSRNRIKTIIESGAVTLNGVVVTEPKKKVQLGDRAVFEVPKAQDPQPKGENIALEIIHEDADVIVINKPAGLVVHPGAGNLDGTLVNALIYHCADSLSGIGGVKRPGIVHRLDKETSGIMVVAKNDQAHQHLSAQFADHGRTGAMRRTYSALVWSAPTQTKMRIETFLGRGDVDRTKQAVVNETRPGARHAVTHIEVIKRFGPADGSNWTSSLVDCTLETGRTHQIRVHMAHIGHPLVGDHVYGASFKTKANTLPDDAQEAVKAFNRQALHAKLLAFEHPKTGEIMQFEASLPADMDKIIQLLSIAWS